MVLSKLSQLLVRLRDHYHLQGLRFEFAEEGARPHEIQWLARLAFQHRLGLCAKIGGCEACSDIEQAMHYGAHELIAPMIESPYALTKFVTCGEKVMRVMDQQVALFANVETITSVEQLPQMMATEAVNKIAGWVIGRIDMCGSLGLPRTQAQSPRLLAICQQVLDLAAAHGQQVVIGGSLNAETVEFLAELSSEALCRIETRKLIFSCPGALGNDAAAYELAAEFEYHWLRFKQSQYQRWAAEDEERLRLLKSRIAP